MNSLTRINEPPLMHSLHQGLSSPADQVNKGADAVPGSQHCPAAHPEETLTIAGGGAPSSSVKAVPPDTPRDAGTGSSAVPPGEPLNGQDGKTGGVLPEKTRASGVPTCITSVEAPSARVPQAVNPADIKARSQSLASQAWKQLAIIEPPEGSDAGSRCELHALNARGESYQVRERHRVLGEPRLNRPYPDPKLSEAGVEQNLPMEVRSNFKWLLSTPLVMGKDSDIVLLPTQYEGGPTWLEDGEYECRDFFIALKRDPETGIYRETSAKMTRQPGWQDVYRSVGRTERIPGTDNRFGVHIEGGTYSGLTIKDTLVYEITRNGIEQVGEWQGHIAFDDLASHPRKPREEWHRETC